MAAREMRRFPAGTVSNSELLDRCARGDQQAWAKVVGRYERVVYSIALRQGLTEETAADATQFAFMTLVKNLDSIEDPERLQSWLITVVRREAWRLKAQASEYTSDDHVRAEESEQFEEKMTRFGDVHAAVNALGEPCRELVLSLFFDPAEPSYVEIAARIGRPVGSIGPTRLRCLARLRESLEWFYGDA